MFDVATVDVIPSPRRYNLCATQRNNLSPLPLDLDQRLALHHSAQIDRKEQETNSKSRREKSTEALAPGIDAVVCQRDRYLGLAFYRRSTSK